MTRALGALSLLGMTVAACLSSPGSTTVELSVFAAASLRAPLEEVERVYEASHPGLDLVVSTGSSAALATQIEQGARADLYLAADLEDPQRLAGGGLGAGEVTPFAENALAIVVPAGNPGRIETPAGLARTEVRILGAGAAVPISRYAARLVENLAAEPGYPAWFAEAYASNVVSREDDVAAIVAKLRLGEGDAGIVYATDAARADGLEEVEIPDGANVRATYAGLVLRSAERPAEARALLEWLTGPRGQALLAGFGFLPRAG